MTVSAHNKKTVPLFISNWKQHPR